MFVTARYRHRVLSRRQGKVLVLLAITLPTLCGLIGLVVDGGLLLAASRHIQHIADSAATAAAMEKQHGKLPVLDPYKDLPVPTTLADPINVKTTTYGGKTVVGLPLIGPPVTVINMGVLGSSFSGLNDPTSPFNGMVIYQRRTDRRPIVLVQENLLGPGQLSGTVYSKWGHVILAGKGVYDARFVSGTMRIIALLDLAIRPSTLLPAAQDIYLVE